MGTVSGKWPWSAILAIAFGALALFIIAMILILRPVPEGPPASYNIRLVPFLTDAGVEVGYRPEEAISELVLPLPAATHGALSVAMNAETVSLEPRGETIAMVGSEPWELATLLIDRSLEAPARAYPLVQYGTGSAVVNLAPLAPVAVDGNRVGDGNPGEPRFNWTGQRPLTWEGEGIVMFYEAALPQALQGAIGNSVATLNDYYAAELGAPTRAALLMLLYAQGDPGQLSIEGDTGGGQVLIRFAGQGFAQEDTEARRRALENIAHELAHLWQLEARGVGAAPDWLHEGAAEAIGLESLYITEIYEEGDYAAMLERARRDCAEGLRAGILENAAGRGTHGASYACGTMIWAALASQTGDTVIATWRDFAAFAAERRDGQSARAFHAFAEERAGEGFADAARKFVTADWSGGNGRLVIDGLFAGDL